MDNLIKEIKCNNCGSTLPYESGRKQFYCSYCGTEILISDKEEKITDELSKINKEVKGPKKRQLELIQKEIEKRRSSFNQKIKYSLFSAFIGGLILLIGILAKTALIAVLGFFIILASVIACILFTNLRKNINTSAIVASYGGKIYVPQIARNGIGYRYPYIREQLEKAGFTNINGVPCEQVIMLLKEEYQIESIKVGDYDIKDLPNIRIDPNTNIEISYYTRKKEISVEIGNGGFSIK